MVGKDWVEELIMGKDGFETGNEGLWWEWEEGGGGGGGWGCGDELLVNVKCK